MEAEPEAFDSAARASAAKRTSRGMGILPMHRVGTPKSLAGLFAHPPSASTFDLHGWTANGP